jgi:cell division protein FtsA
VAPFAAGLAVLVEDEMDLGVTVIDMGGGTTSLAVFYDGSVVFTDSVPVGGVHVTQDIARGLGTAQGHAERIKTVDGSAFAGPSDAREMIEVPPIGEEDAGQDVQVARSALVAIIRPRLEEILEMVRGRLQASGFEKLAGRRAVLIGGASQLQGLRELAAHVLDKRVRLGRVIRVRGLPDTHAGPAFATCAGMLSFAAQAPTDAALLADTHILSAGGLFGRIGHWLRETF